MSGLWVQDLKLPARVGTGPMASSANNANGFPWLWQPEQASRVTSYFAVTRRLPGQGLHPLWGKGGWGMSTSAVQISVITPAHTNAAESAQAGVGSAITASDTGQPEQGVEERHLIQPLFGHQSTMLDVSLMNNLFDVLIDTEQHEQGSLWDAMLGLLGCPDEADADQASAADAAADALCLVYDGELRGKKRDYICSSQPA